MIVITGASGHLGRLVIAELLKKLPASEIVAAVRNPLMASDLAALGVGVRHADYTRPETLDAAFEGAEKLLLISSSEIGQRVAHHRNIIEAAALAEVELVAYTSILRASTSPLGLAADHRKTESLLEATGLPCVLLRNGWYTENYLANISSALQSGVLIGCAGNGKISSAARADYAAAAAEVLTRENQAGRVYELAGDEAYTLIQLATEVTLQTGKPLVYQNMSEADYTRALVGAGVPESVAEMLADSDIGASKGGLFSDDHQLSRLIGRPTTSLAASIKAALS